MNSIDLDFEAFLGRLQVWRVQMEATPLPWPVVRAQAYQEHTHLLMDAMRSGSHARLEAAVFGLEVAA